MNNWNELNSKIDINDAWLLAMFSDRILIDKYPLTVADNENILNNSFDKLLDIRVFNKDKEYRLFRGSLDQEFSYRCLADNKEEGAIVREQFIDIDTKRSNKNEIYSTGGGKYSLPLDNLKDAKLVLKEYVDYDEFGNAYIKDFRLAGFKEGETNGK